MLFISYLIDFYELSLVIAVARILISMTSLTFVRLVENPEINAYVLRARMIAVRVPTCILTPCVLPVFLVPTSSRSPCSPCHPHI